MSGDQLAAGPEDAPNLTRAEARRAREAQAQYQDGARGGRPGVRPGPDESTRAARRAQVATSSRRRSILRAWWFYVLIVVIALCVWLGVRSTQQPQSPPGVHVTTPAPEA